MGLLVCLELRLSTMKPTWPRHSPSGTFLSHGFVNKCISRDTGELLETMGTTPAGSCPEGRGNGPEWRRGEKGERWRRSGWLGKGTREEERALPGGITRVCILHKG